MRALFAIAIALVGAAGGATAQSAITPDEFLDAVMGKTVTFSMFPTGEVVGHEQFIRRDFSLWRFEGGECMYGEITVDGSNLCFLYEGDPAGKPICWVPFRDGDRLFVREPVLVRAETQFVSRILDEPMSCPEQPLS